MLARAQLNRIMYDDSLTRHLGDEEARVLIEWLADAAERIPPDPAEAAAAAAEALCRRGRVLSRLVRLWCHEGEQGAAAQLAVCEGLVTALPSGHADPYLVMRRLVIHEATRRVA